MTAARASSSAESSAIVGILAAAAGVCLVPVPALSAARTALLFLGRCEVVESNPAVEPVVAAPVAAVADEEMETIYDLELRLLQTAAPVAAAPGEPGEGEGALL